MLLYTNSSKFNGVPSEHKAKGQVKNKGLKYMKVEVKVKVKGT